MDYLPQPQDTTEWFEEIKLEINNAETKNKLMRFGFNTIHESLRTPNLDLRPTPPCPIKTVLPWLIYT